MSISITIPDYINSETSEVILALVKRCNRAEELDLPITSEVSAITSLILAQRGDVLAGVAHISYGPEAEICLCVDPQQRRKGIGSALVAATKTHLATQKLAKAIFVADHAAASGQAFATAMGAQQIYAEYRMDLDLHAIPPPPAPIRGLSIRPAGSNDALAIASVLIAAFNDPPAMVTRFVTERISNPAHRFFLGEIAGRPVSTLRLVGDNGWIYVTAFATLPDLHGRGLGRRMLMHTLGMLIAEGQQAVRIEVETTNRAALRLYKSCGFRHTRTFAFFTLADKNLFTRSETT
ncbi:MAG: GNAT family N-acetyltransferase [Oscillochloris sp.]|nr:GNAT family N-acetyltransferase [Oscillochloris sp.]